MAMESAKAVNDPEGSDRILGCDDDAITFKPANPLGDGVDGGEGEGNGETTNKLSITLASNI